MSRLAKTYIFSIITAGTLVALWSIFQTEIRAPERFAVYMIVGCIASVLKVTLPGINGTMSTNFLFVLLAVVDLSLGEAVSVACAGVIVQFAWNSRGKFPPPMRLMQIAFNLSSITLAAAGAAGLFHSSWLRRLNLENAVLLCFVGAAYFVLNTLPVALVVALTEGKPMTSTWQNCYFWSFPYYLVGAGIVALLQSLASVVGWQTSLISLPLVYTIYRSYSLYLERLSSEKHHAEEMAGLHLRTIEALALAIEAKDHTTNDHLQRVKVYAEELGRDLHLTPDEMDALRAAALLHDIGKLAVPEHIISKPGKLTPEEFEKMKIHPVVGAEILERVQFPYPVVPIVAAHHEKWDGSGYPHGLSGENIPIGARILSVVDCLDALASDRQYRRALPLDEAMEMVRAQAGKAFDPNIVDRLSARYQELEEMARAANVDQPRLSTDVVVTRGAAPDAGFESSGPALPILSAKNKQPDFLSSIAAARNEVQFLFELSNTLGSSLSLVDTMSMLAQRLQTIVPHDGLAIYLIRGRELRAEFAAGQDAELFSRLVIPVGQGLSGWVAETGKPIVNGNPSVEPGYLNDKRKFSTLRSALAIPLEGTAGRIGVLSVYHREREAFTQDQIRILLAISSKLSMAVENSLRFQAAEDSAVTDHLTGLPNGRSLFVYLEQEVERCQMSQTPLALLVCDLDGFKQVNDIYGHLEGNKILCEVAALLRANCRESDYVARMGGDEFVLVLPGLSPESVQSTIRRIQLAIGNCSMECFGRDIFAISVGAAELRPGLRAEDLLGEADRLMYKVKQDAKKDGRSRRDGRPDPLALAGPAAL